MESKKNCKAKLDDNCRSICLDDDVSENLSGVPKRNWTLYSN